MNGFLLDTNVVSELTRDAPSTHVIEFLANHDDLWLPSIVIHELEYGLRLLPSGRRQARLTAVVSSITSVYEDRILTLDRIGAEWSARFRAQARRSGHILDLGDALIAGTARANNLAIATRNVADFRYVAVDVFNPWDPRP
ncbi:MAG: type II toxin-antitoxin system VapC family toxin [Acidimicrobiia bacterium]|nr:type II toxin-antitoxin system VapC family toxin [Acidimicrobiia bacterium]MYF83312.1 type II toxin-antitoxin system VapC family toxin [Acidimicrobiia bacterium]